MHGKKTFLTFVEKERLTKPPRHFPQSLNHLKAHSLFSRYSPALYHIHTHIHIISVSPLCLSNSNPSISIAIFLFTFFFFFFFFFTCPSIDAMVRRYDVDDGLVY